MSHAHDEYIDYSCSTSVERLARDVETVLRKWHVADGSDRHVSFASSSSHGGSRMASRQTSQVGVADKSRDNSGGVADAPSIGDDRMDIEKLNATPGNERAPVFDADTGAVRLIRSEDVTLASFPLPCPLHEGDHHQMIQSGFGSASNRVDVALTVSLWDGPPRQMSNPSDNSCGDGDINAPSLPPLPLSLTARYDPNGGVMSPSITSDLCALLGIGQHITLSPKAGARVSGANDSPIPVSDEILNAEAGMLLQSVVLARANARSAAKNHTHDKRSKMKSALQAFTKGKDPSSEDIMDHLHGSATLCSLLQTALNLAISACDCRIPAFGLWTSYDPQRWRSAVSGAVGFAGDGSCGEFSIPLWLAGGWAAMDGIGKVDYQQDTIPMTIPLALRATSIPSAMPEAFPTHQVPATFVGRCHPGPRLGSGCGNFSVYAIPSGLKGAEHLGTLNGLAYLLLDNIPSSERNTQTVQVIGARHCYRWERVALDARDRKRKWSHEDEAEALSLWRLSSNDVVKADGDDTQLLTSESLAVIDYRRSCESHATRLLERAAALGLNDKRGGSHQDQDHVPPYPKLWGPDVDPVFAFFTSVTWNDITSTNGVESVSASESFIGPDHGPGSKVPSPLLSLPLKTRSSHQTSLTDIKEIERSLLSTLFDPRNVGPSAFEVCASFDVDSPCTKLGASNRCLLAGLLKVANLDDETLVGHIVQRTVQDELHNWETELDKTGQNPARALMDRARVGGTTRQLYDAMDWKSMANAKRSHLEDDVEAALGVALSGGSILEGGTPFPSPPVGIFRSDESSNGRSGDNESFYLGALDLSAFGSAPPGRLLSVFFASIASLRTPSAMAGAWLDLVDEMRSRWDERESLPNLGVVPGIESATKEYEKRMKMAEDSRSSRLSKFISPPIGRQLGSRALCAAFVHSSEPEPDLHNCLIAQKLQIFNICVECAIAAESGPMDMDIDITEKPSDEFFDAFDDEDEDGNARQGLDSSFQIDEKIAGRKGVRCPVHGVSLIKTGDQLYAPYLQRTEPMSRDELLQRRAILAEASTSPSGEKYSIQDRLEVAHRLQKAKLSSDMSSFKAANPAACLEDFTAWYGNPDNPLDEYSEGKRNALPSPRNKSASLPSNNSKENLEKASEAIHALTAMRNFWYETWEKAPSLAASEQEPLFDHDVTANIAMHALETIHPANLLNQILAINLSAAVFVLYSEAGASRQIPAVRNVLQKLGNVVEAALLDLMDDRCGRLVGAKGDAKDGKSLDDIERYVSVETVASCEEACNAIGEAEVIVSRATSLLTKFPGRHSLIQDILVTSRHVALVDDVGTRADVMETILSLQKRQGASSESVPTPSMQEYVLRSQSDSDHQYASCQLTARMQSGHHPNQRGLLLALSKCDRS